MLLSLDIGTMIMHFGIERAELRRRHAGKIEDAQIVAKLGQGGDLFDVLSAGL